MPTFVGDCASNVIEQWVLESSPRKKCCFGRGVHARVDLENPMTPFISREGLKVFVEGDDPTVKAQRSVGQTIMNCQQRPKHGWSPTRMKAIQLNGVKRRHDAAANDFTPQLLLVQTSIPANARDRIEQVRNVRIGEETGTFHRFTIRMGSSAENPGSCT